jgi:nucleotide-binding universal stress UspA family protein
MPSQEDVFEEFGREFILRQHIARRPIERVLAAVDFSICSLAALEYAEELARQFGAELVLLHATGAPSMPAEVSHIGPEAAERALTRAVGRLREHGLRVRGVLRPGAPADEILRVAEAERAGLIVMGTHGRSGVARVLMGSVAERIVRAAPCPVLTVGPPRNG